MADVAVKIHFRYIQPSGGENPRLDTLEADTRQGCPQRSGEFLARPAIHRPQKVPTRKLTGLRFQLQARSQNEILLPIPAGWSCRDLEHAAKSQQLTREQGEQVRNLVGHKPRVQKIEA